MKRDRESRTAPAPPDAFHMIKLEDGKFHGTSPQQLVDAFNRIDADDLPDLCIFFHGGLVSESAGLKSAAKLLEAYGAARAYPFFFIWRSGLLDVIKKKMRRAGRRPAFVVAANRAVALVAGKMALALDDDRTLRARPREFASRRARSLKQLAVLTQKYDKAWSQAPAVQLGASSSELKQFERFLLTLEPKLPRSKRLFQAEAIQGSDNPLAKIIQRFNTRHDHDLFTTVIEELLIAAGVRKEIGGPIWHTMKDFIDDSFGNDDLAGGRAVVEQLCQLLKKKPELRVTLIGHSAGTIYIQRFLEELNARLGTSKVQVEVLFLAAALTFERMDQGLTVWRRRVGNLRFFGMNNQRVGGYWEVWFLYNKSLLYIVSSLCEDDPNTDKPIVGMQRYWMDQTPYPDPQTKRVKALAGSRTVWAPSCDSPGWCSDADRHGGFPEDPQTLTSVAYILQSGF